MIPDPVAGLRTQIRALTEDNGEEWMWAEPVEPGGYRLLSVPVFAYGLSRGTIVDGEASGEDGALTVARVRTPSPGATMRIYLADDTKAGDFYSGAFISAAAQRGLSVGPATLLEPSVIALHIRDRGAWQAVAKLMDGIVSNGQAKFWELGDPDESPSTDDSETRTKEVSTRAKWRLVHPPPGDPLSLARRE